MFNHARILTSGVYGPESEAAYFCQCVLDSSARSLCLWGSLRIFCALRLQVVCGRGVCVRVGVYALFCGLIFAIGVTRLPRVHEWKLLGRGCAWGVVTVSGSNSFL